MENSTECNSRELTPVVFRGSSRTSLVAPNDERRSSQVFCNVRHMLAYIDQVESENYRHTKAIDDQFQAIKQELYCALRGEQPVDGDAFLESEQWEPLIGEMERDLQLNQVAMSGIGKNLARLKAQFEETKRNSQQKSGALLGLAASARPMSVQYRTPLTNRLEYSPTEASSDGSVPQIRRSSTAPSSQEEAIFKVPTFVPSARRRLSFSTDRSTGELDSSVKTRKRKHSDKSTESWHITIKPGDSQRFINVIQGLPKDDPLVARMSAEQRRKEVEATIGWIDRWHVGRKKKTRNSRRQ